MYNQWLLRCVYSIAKSFVQFSHNMEHTKWIILFACFVFADSAPFLTQPSEERDITEVLKRRIHRIMEAGIENPDIPFNDIREDIPRAIVVGRARYLKVQPPENGVVFIHRMVSLIALAKYYNQSSEIFPVNGMFSYTVQNTAADGGETKSNDSAYKVEVSDVDHFDVLQIKNYTACRNQYKECSTKEIDLIPSNYFQSHEEEKTKHELKKLINKIIKGKLEKENYNAMKAELIRTFGELLHNTMVQYYPVGTISTSNYTLSNVTIKGLWNMQSASLNMSDSESVVHVDLGAVTGSMMQYFELEKKEPLELSFNASNIHIYEYRNATGRKANGKIMGYSVKNTKTNMLLEENESKSIMEQVGSAFAVSVVSEPLFL